MKEAPEIDDSRGFQNFLLILVRGRLVLDLPIDGSDTKSPVQRPSYFHSIDAKRGKREPNEPSDQRYVYFQLREIVPKPELTWNSLLSSTSTRDSEG